MGLDWIGFLSGCGVACSVTPISCQTGDVSSIPTVDHRWLILPGYTQPSADTKLLIEKLKLKLPSQPPTRITEHKEAHETDLQTVG